MDWPDPVDFKLYDQIIHQGTKYERRDRLHAGHAGTVTNTAAGVAGWIGVYRRSRDIVAPADGNFGFFDGAGAGSFEKYTTGGTTGWRPYNPFAAGEPWAAYTFIGAFTYADNADILPHVSADDQLWLNKYNSVPYATSAYDAPAAEYVEAIWQKVRLFSTRGPLWATSPLFAAASSLVTALSSVKLQFPVNTVWTLSAAGTRDGIQAALDSDVVSDIPNTLAIPSLPPGPEVDGIWIVSEVDGVEVDACWIPWGPSGVFDNQADPDNATYGQTLATLKVAAGDELLPRLASQSAALTMWLEILKESGAIVVGAGGLVLKVYPHGVFAQ